MLVLDRLLLSGHGEATCGFVKPNLGSFECFYSFVHSFLNAHVLSTVDWHNTVDAPFGLRGDEVSVSDCAIGFMKDLLTISFLKDNKSLTLIRQLNSDICSC
jgi:hypothetical protein